ncbi:KRAB-A domain-containing 2 [Brachionus plicatilis]|uniref:KRAB-A domain-containing 2 n=1 Tax=Brachionus plicatilis TaxID=10195 RepID=A0A3M7Q7L8_BRAPC|nr:KRAB-A domain-containing 2 [Brachionus plicatilis]
MKCKIADDALMVKIIETIQEIEDALIIPNNNAVQQQNLNLKEKFTNHLCQHFKKNLQIDDLSIEKDKITKKQLDYLIGIIENHTKVKNCHRYRKNYAVKTTGDIKQLIEKSEKKTNGLVIVAIEDMYDVVLKLHVAVGYQGRVGFLKEAIKFYANVTRPIVDIPYKALFGHEMFNGLDVLNLPEEETKKIKAAKELFLLLGKNNEADEQLDDEDDDDENVDDSFVVSDDLLKLRDELNPKRKAPEPEPEYDEPDQDQENLNPIQTREKQIKKARLNAVTGQKKTIKKMLSRNKKVINSFKVGDLVLYHSEDVDRGASDPQNILCVILEKKNELFKLGCRAGVFDSFVAFNCIEKTALITEFSIEFIPKDKKDEYVSVGAREAVRLLSIGHGQGYLKCNCTGNCATKRCSCKKANLKCSSKCHGKEFKCANCE